MAASSGPEPAGEGVRGSEGPPLGAMAWVTPHKALGSSMRPSVRDAGSSALVWGSQHHVVEAVMRDGPEPGTTGVESLGRRGGGQPPGGLACIWGTGIPPGGAQGCEQVEAAPTPRKDLGTKARAPPCWP